MQTAILTIAGMNSPAAMRSVRSALSAIDGVEDVQISESLRQTTVSYDPRKVVPKQFLVAVSVVGCEVGKLTIKSPAAGAVHLEGSGATAGFREVP